MESEALYLVSESPFKVWLRPAGAGSGWPGLRDTLSGFGASVERRECPSGGHWLNSPAGIDDAMPFLDKFVVEKGTWGKGLAAGSGAV